MPEVNGTVKVDLLIGRSGRAARSACVAVRDKTGRERTSGLQQRAPIASVPPPRVDPPGERGRGRAGAREGCHGLSGRQERAGEGVRRAKERVEE